MISNGKAALRPVLQFQKYVLRSSDHIRALSTEPPAPTGDVIFKESGNAGIIILNRPKDMNAVSHTMLLAMTQQLQEYEKFKSLIISKSAAPKIFSAGGDVVETFKRIMKKDRTAFITLRYAYQMVNLVHTARVPFIALMDGVIMGGGAGMSVVAKYPICTENTDLAMPEIRIGLCCDVGSSYFLSRLKNHVGFYLALTGARLRGYDNVHAGTAKYFCESAKLPELEKALATTSDVDGAITSICEKPQDAPAYSLEPHLDKIDRIFSSESAEEIVAKLEEDGGPWAKKTAATMRYMCPLALKAVLHNMHLGKDRTLHECLQNEWILANTFFAGDNFKEGVRAHLRDKDNKPKWVPRRLEDVTPQMIQDLYKAQKFLGPLELRSSK